MVGSFILRYSAWLSLAFFGVIEVQCAVFVLGLFSAAFGRRWCSTAGRNDEGYMG